MKSEALLTTDALNEDALKEIEGALQDVLGAQFEDEVRAHTGNEKWYRATLPVGELFRLWIRGKILESADPAWVFHGLRMADRRRLFLRLGLDLSVISNSTPNEHAELVLKAVGLPVRRSRGHRALLEDWRELNELIDTGEDERAATLGRQRAERFLRKLLYFYCSVGYAGQFALMLKDPGSLRVPRDFGQATESGFAELFVNDDVADLGFLALALRKLSSRIEDAGLPGLSGAPLVIIGQRDYEAFSAFGTALQPYTHDKPSKDMVRREAFKLAAQVLLSTVEAMVARNVVPDDAFVLETCLSLVGQVFRGAKDDGTQVHLMAQTAPPLGQRVLYLASAGCRYASCVWARNPWKT